MATILLLDALYPPDPDQLVRDLDSVGADGVAIYCWRPDGKGGVDVGNWTPAYAPRLRRARKRLLGIVVPPPTGGDIGAMLDAVAAMGLLPGDPVSNDLEDPNLPPAGWEEAFDAEQARRGYPDLDYGTRSNLGRYVPDRENWLADWLLTGRLDPRPVLQPGQAARQFANSIPINGSEYDASIVDASVFPLPVSGGVDMQPIICTSNSDGDPHGKGAIYLLLAHPLSDGTWFPDPAGRKRYIPDVATTGVVEKYLPLVTVDPFLLDRIEEAEPYTTGQYPRVDPVAALELLQAVKTEVDAVQAALQAGGAPPAPADLSKVYEQLGALGKHLGVDVTTGQPS